MFPSLPRVVLASSFLVVSGSLVVSAPETASRPVLSEFLGLNGHTVQFKPDLYQPVGRLVRDYHPVQWDLGDEPSKPPQFPLARNKVDWNQVYGSWKKAGWETEACLMFESVDRAKWKDLPGEARAYGKAFAEAFGPSGTRKLVRAVEIGNEPGSWSDEDYATMFRAMAEGLRSGDPALRIATCNLTASGSGKYEKSVRCIEGLLPLVDVLTIHTYPMLEQWPTWKRSFPEDPRLPRYLPDVAALCRWRDQKAPGKPVWITEFGYDACTQPPPADGDFKQWTDVTDARQAQWLVRSVLVFSSLPVERAYIYFFNDDDKPGLHASSGLTRHFQPKPAFHALAHLQSTLGEYRFEKIVRDEAGAVRIQQYRHGSQPKRIVWALWSPTGEGREAEITLEVLPGRPVSATRMPAAPGPWKDEAEGWKPVGERSVKIRLTEDPLYLRIEEN